MYRLFLSQSLVSLCELRSTTDFPYTAELDSAFGAAVGGMGPRWVYHMCVVCCFVVVVYRWPGPVYLPAVVWLLLFMVCCCLHTGESSCKFYVLGVVWLSLFTGWLGENNCCSIAVHCTTITTLRCHLSLSVLCWLPFLYSWTQRGTQCTCIVYTPV